MSHRHGPHDGFVPATDIILTIETHLGLEHEEWEEDDPRLAPLSGMWEFSDLRKQLGIRQNGGKLRWIPFWLADALLCKLRLANLWRSELEHIYLGVNLTDELGNQYLRPTEKGWRRCARGGCVKVFPLRDPEGGKGSYHPNRRYCSDGCAATDAKHQRGARSQLSRRFDQCPSGHDRSPENVYEYTIRSGKKAGTRVRRCRICFNNAQRAYRAERKAA